MYVSKKPYSCYKRICTRETKRKQKIRLNNLRYFQEKITNLRNSIKKS